MVDFTPSGLAHRNILGELPLFDPEQGTTVIEPPGGEKGYWSGAPCAVYDEAEERFLLSYRVRKPLTMGRGVESRIAESRDGRSFSPIWCATKEQLDSLSIERSNLIKTPTGKWRLYVSHATAYDYRWVIEMMEADRPEDLDPAQRIVVLDSDMTHTQGVKDPVIVIVGGMWYMYVNYAPQPEKMDAEMWNKLHSTGNAFVTGVVNTGSALTTSTDGVDFSWKGEVIGPGPGGWDAFLARMSTIVYIPPVYYAIYDGRPNVKASYEDKPGLATSHDLRTFVKLTPHRPVMQSPHGTGCMRYVDAVLSADRIFYYYEYARANGSHELRMNIVDL